MSIKILTDSTSYIDDNIKREFDIKVVSLNVKFEDVSFREVDIDNKDFYTMMEQKGIPISSQPSVEELYNAMKAVVENGDDLICTFISSDMSGTYSTAHLAKQMILEENNNANIVIVDSRSNCMQLGYDAILPAKAAKAGKSMEEVKKVMMDTINRSRFLFIPDNLVYLKKGGRIGGANALIGNLLKIIPILTVEDGKTTVFAKVRTKKKAKISMVEKVIDDIERYGLGEITVHHINAYEEAKELADYIYEKLNVVVQICSIGPVIGVHVGPGALGIAYYTQKDMR